MTYRIRCISFTAESGAFRFHAVLSKLNRDHPEQLVTLKDIKFLRHVATYLVVRSTRVVVLSPTSLLFPTWYLICDGDMEAFSYAML